MTIVDGWTIIFPKAADSHSPALAQGPQMTYPPAAEHPLCLALATMARRAEPDLILKARYLGFRKEVVSALGRRQPGLVVKLALAEVERLADTVLAECRQWREAGDWEDHRRHLQVCRAAALFHMWMAGEGLKIARAHDAPTGSVHVRTFDAHE